MCRKSRNSKIINHSDRHKKHLAYGQIKGMFWCDCDRSGTNKVNKKAERRRAKKFIKEQSQMEVV